MPSALAVAEVLSVLECEALKKSSVVALQGTMREATEKGLATVEVQVFAMRIYAAIHQYRCLLEYAATLPEQVRALPEVAELIEQAKAQQ